MTSTTPGTASGYAGRRRTDPRIAARIHSALGPTGTVLNVGAGAGSYEPSDRRVIAVEPSEAMVAQRPAGSPPAVRAVAAPSPWPTMRSACSMATVTVHQWPDPMAGLAELRRVTRGPVVVADLRSRGPRHAVAGRVLPRAPARPRPGGIRPSTAVVAALGPGTTAHTGTGPLRLRGRLHRGVLRSTRGVPRSRRAAIAVSLELRGRDAEARAVDNLAADLASGRWDGRFGHLRHQADLHRRAPAGRRAGHRPPPGLIRPVPSPVPSRPEPPLQLAGARVVRIRWCLRRTPHRGGPPKSPTCSRGLSPTPSPVTGRCPPHRWRSDSTRSAVRGPRPSTVALSR